MKLGWIGFGHKYWLLGFGSSDRILTGFFQSNHLIALFLAKRARYAKVWA